MGSPSLRQRVSSHKQCLLRLLHLPWYFHVSSQVVDNDCSVPHTMIEILEPVAGFRTKQSNKSSLCRLQIFSTLVSSVRAHSPSLSRSGMFRHWHFGSYLTTSVNPLRQLNPRPETPIPSWFMLCLLLVLLWLFLLSLLLVLLFYHYRYHRA